MGVGSTNATHWDLLQEAEEERLTFQQDVFRDLVGWYLNGNELAVQAFVDVNDCMDRVNEQLEDGT